MTASVSSGRRACVMECEPSVMQRAGDQLAQFGVREKAVLGARWSRGRRHGFAQPLDEMYGIELARLHARDGGQRRAPGFRAVEVAELARPQFIEHQPRLAVAARAARGIQVSGESLLPEAVGLPM